VDIDVFQNQYKTYLMSRKNIENQGDPYVLVIEFSKFDNLNGV
jgi:hypothetical protein